MMKTVLQEPGGRRRAKNTEPKSSKNYTEIVNIWTNLRKYHSRESKEKIYVKILFFYGEKSILSLFHNQYWNFLKKFCGVNLGLVYLQTN